MSKPDSTIDTAALFASLLQDPTIEVPAAILMEEVHLQTDDEAEPVEDSVPRDVDKVISIRNIVRRTRTRLTLFTDGFLQASTRGPGRRRSDLLFDLRFMHARPVVTRHFSSHAARATAGLFVASAAAAALVYLSIFPRFSAVAATVFLVGAIIGLVIFARRTYEKVAFHTLTGQVEALVLRSNPGCMRTHREAMPAIVRAIILARRKRSKDRHEHLRQEMREHYRLRATGAIDAETCDAATRRVLRGFG